METFRAISTRRTVREFDGHDVPRDLIDRILEAGRRAPSSMNDQRWDLILCSDRQRLAALARTGDYAEHLAGAAFAVALVVPEAREVWERESIAFDLGQLAENMMLAAWELGIGSAHASVYDEPMARKLLGYPDGSRCDTILSFGYPKDPAVLSRPPSERRRPFSEVVHEEDW